MSHQELSLSIPEVLPALSQEAEVRRRQARRHPRGMTLVEIMIVLTIIAGIMVTVGVVAFNQLDKANIQTTRVALRKISGQIQQYYSFQSPPALPDSLTELINPPGGESAYAKDTDVKDAWGQEIQYEKTGNKDYKLRSIGPDGQDGTEDDIEYEE